MSTPSRPPSPLLSPGTLESVSEPKSRVRITVLTILALHVVFIGGLLLQGCQKGTKDPMAAGGSSNAVSSLPSLVDTQYFTTFPGDAPAVNNPLTTAAPTDLSQQYPTSTPTRAPVESVPDIVSALPSSPQQNSTTFSTPLTSTTSYTSSYGQGTEHVIQKGDTIGELAKRYGVTTQAILDANPEVQPRALKLEAKLVIPAPTAPAAREAAEPIAPPGGEIYIVKSGDNLTKIAKKFGVTVRQIRSANNLRGDRILPKQRLVIPPKSEGSSSTNPAVNPTF